MKKILLIFAVLFIISFFIKDDVASIITSNAVYGGKQEENIPSDFGKINLYFCPKDDCEGVLLDQIRNAETVDCAFFDFNLEEVMTELKEKTHRLIIDDQYYEKVNIDNVRKDTSKGYMHNKFCVLDNSIVLTGSMNPTYNDVNKNNNNFVVIESKLLAENYENEFNEMWMGEFGKGENLKYPKIMFNGFLVENLFCPEDNCEEKVLEILKTARERIYFMTFSFTSDEIGEEIVKNFHYGVDIKGIFDTTQAGSQYSEFNKMSELGMNVKKDKNPKNMHHKVFIVDDAVIFGSYNPTDSGNKRNDENVLVIHNRGIAEQFIKEFDFLWGL